MGVKVGSGAFSVVYAATEKAGEKHAVAVKAIDKSKLKGKLDAVEREVSLMRRIDHPNALKLFDSVDSPLHTFVITNLLSGGELFDRIINKGHYTEKDAVKVLDDCLSALEWMHEHKIVHRDIKPENLIYATAADDSPIIVSDFGLAAAIDSEEDRPTKACGTPGYVAPEVLQKGVAYDYGCDVWSVGVVAYILLCGYPPFFSEEEGDDSSMYAAILEGTYEYDSPYWDDITAPATSFVSSLLTVDPSKRFNASEALRDPWISHDVAGAVNLHRSVSTELKKNFPKRMWKKAFNAQIALMRLTGDHSNFGAGGSAEAPAAGDSAAAGDAAAGKEG